MVGEHGLGGARDGEVVVGAAGRDHVGAALEQLGDHARPRKPAPPVTTTRRSGQNGDMSTMLGRCGHHGAVPDPVRVAYTLEQCWHRVPGRHRRRRAADRRALGPRTRAVELVGRRRPAPPAAARSRGVPPFPVAALPLARPWLYESWLRLRWPPVERATGPVDVVPRHRARAGTDAARRSSSPCTTSRSCTAPSRSPGTACA